MKVIVAGDFAPRHRLAKQMEERRFDEIFSDCLVYIIKSADYSLVNFESPIIEKDYKPIKKVSEFGEDSFNDNIEYLNEIIRNEKSLNEAITDFYKNNTKNLECIFMPIKNRYLNYIWSKFYPKIISDKTRMSILAHLQCESHLPRVLYKLKNR